MKAKPIILLLVVWAIQSGTLMPQPVEKENFNQFFSRFALEKEFQLERIEFPLTRIVLAVDPDPRGDFIDQTVRVDKSDWKHEYFYYKSDRNYRAQLFDNFDGNLRDTDERVFAWLGVQTGYQMYYYFQRIDGKWYLVKIRDLSIL